jgi:hypothetical protein
MGGEEIPAARFLTLIRSGEMGVRIWGKAVWG